MSIEVYTPVHSETVKLYYLLKDSKTGGTHPDFVNYLEAYSLDPKIDNIRFGLTSQQVEGSLRNIGIYVQGDAMYDDDGGGHSSFAVIVDFLLRNSDGSNYLRYGDCLTSYLNSLSIGMYSFVQGVSYSLATTTTNNRVTAMMVVVLPPKTDSFRY